MMTDPVGVEVEDFSVVENAMQLVKILSDKPEIAAGFEAWQRLNQAALRARVKCIKESASDTPSRTRLGIVAWQEA